MLMSVTERTREIGLKSHWCTPGTNKDNFFSKPWLFTGTGGVLGNAFELAFAFNAKPLLAGGNDWHFLFYPHHWEFLSLLPSLGIVFGLSPARRASKLKPLKHFITNKCDSLLDFFGFPFVLFAILGEKRLTRTGNYCGTAIVIIVLSVGAGVRALILNQIASITPETLWIQVQKSPVEEHERKKIVPQDKHSLPEYKLRRSPPMTKMISKTFKCRNRIRLSLVRGNLPIKQENRYILGNQYGIFHDRKPLPFWRTIFTERENESLAQVAVLGSDIEKKNCMEIPPP